MIKNNEEPLADIIAELLKKERAALLNGSLDEMIEIVPLKSEIAARLEQAEPEELEGLRGMKEMAQRNQNLLEAALKGIQAVVRRSAELQKIRSQLDTYDSDGRKQVIKDHRQSIERLA